MDKRDVGVILVVIGMEGFVVGDKMRGREREGRVEGQRKTVFVSCELIHITTSLA